MPTGYGTTRGRLLAAIAALMVLAGAALLWLGLRGLTEAPDVQLGAATHRTTVDAGAGGFSLWSPDASAFATAVCTADDRTLLRPVSGYGVEVDGATYHELARSPQGLTGEVVVSCEPAQEFRVGPPAQAASSTGLRGTAGVLAGTTLLVLGLALEGWVLVAGARRRRMESFRVPARRLDPGPSTTPPTQTAAPDRDGKG
ncbi:hypothetical protein [Ornithinimicrobium avium]|uniref:Uncharacterized protein n=1 Tax=Ornithinimicrobium avium TaxID=2283195 RepID=A0A345NKX2_9MICO|nr:hypothetical protein [Ornithinimicrobium avium]AXH95680.1 hypothetical protein DV701_05685 [Ornithinimicrobium avium]